MNPARRARFPGEVAFLILLLVGCATRPPVSTQSDWEMSGKLAVRTEHQRESASFVWRQIQDRFELRLMDPFGRILAEASGAAGVLDIDVSDRLHVDPVLLRTIEEDMPVGFLSYWLRGRPAPGAADVSALPDGTLPGRIQQAGWLIEFLGYKEQRVRKMRVSRADVDLLIVVSQWHGEVGD